MMRVTLKYLNILYEIENDIIMSKLFSFCLTDCLSVRFHEKNLIKWQNDGARGMIKHHSECGLSEQKNEKEKTIWILKAFEAVN